jgi:hypothetical protein
MSSRGANTTRGSACGWSAAARAIIMAWLAKSPLAAGFRGLRSLPDFALSSCSASHFLQKGNRRDGFCSLALLG